MFEINDFVVVIAAHEGGEENYNQYNNYYKLHVEAYWCPVV